MGREALLIELDGDSDVAATYEFIGDLVERGQLPRPRDVVPAARTVLVDGVPEPASWLARLESAATVHWSEHRADSSPLVSQVEVRVPVHYDGPDLEEVARVWQCDVAEVAARHSAATFTVAFCGFAPGFAYCVSDPPLSAVPRRGDPRPEVAAGSVGLAGAYSGVYPRAMPGGWQLIGSTSLVVFDADREPAALLRPGTRVRFEARS